MPAHLKNVIRRNKGFTLVEILAVLVIIGFIAAVAIPKYYDLQEDAKNKAIDSAKAAALAALTGYFGKALLNGATPASIDYDNTETDLGDFEITDISPSGQANEMIVTVSGKSNTQLNGYSATVVFHRLGV